MVILVLVEYFHPILYIYIYIYIHIYIYIYANSDVELTKLLQIYMDKLKYWFDINNLKLNIQK